MRVRVALVSLVLGLGACTVSSGSSRDRNKDDAGSIDPELMRKYSQQIQKYTDAMLLCGSTLPNDWEEAKHQFELLQPFLVFQEDPELIRQFRSGSEPARKELARRGVMLRSVILLSGPFDRVKWDEARKTLMDAGESGQILLSSTLLQMLLNAQNQMIWVHIRFAIVEAGPIALETTIGLTKEFVKSTPANSPMFKRDDLIQLMMVIIGFGDAGRPFLEEVSKTDKANVRRAVATAIGESSDGASVPTLIQLLQDSDWAVRTASAEAMGHLASVRSTAGPALLDRLGRERDPLVLRTVLRAIGDLLYLQAVPDLMRVIEVPSREISEAAMQALYIITGEKFLRRDDWQEWYRTRYPDWKKKHVPGP